MSEPSSKVSSYSWIILSIITLLGAGLRLFQLGKDSFWLDEAGVAIAAAEPKLSSALSIARTHVSAMPLDYVIAWCMARFSLDEGWLRLPAVVWGVLAIWMGYFLIKQLAGNQAALISALLLAIHPGLIAYSQELRFYSGLVFFTLFSTFWIIRAVNRSSLPVASRSSIWDWVWAFLSVIVGAYYHVYVVFTWLTGFLYGLIVLPQGGRKKRTLFQLCLSALISGLAFLPGYLYFVQLPGGDSQFIADLVPIFLLKAFYFVPGHDGPFVWLLGILLFFLVISGVIFVFLRRNRAAVAVFVSMVIQILIVLALDAWTGYFFEDRQLLMLVPFTCMFAALSILEGPYRASAGNELSQVKSHWLQNGSRALAGTWILLILIATVPYLQNYYNLEKSRGFELSAVLVDRWHSGDQIWTVPQWDPLLYEYYLVDRLGHPEISSVIEGKQYADVLKDPLPDANILLLVPSVVDPSIRSAIEARGFQPDPVWGQSQSDVDILFTLDHKS